MTLQELENLLRRVRKDNSNISLDVTNENECRFNREIWMMTQENLENMLRTSNENEFPNNQLPTPNLKYKYGVTIEGGKKTMTIIFNSNNNKINIDEILADIDKIKEDTNFNENDPIICIFRFEQCEFEINKKHQKLSKLI